MTVKQLIEFLKMAPADSEVRMVIEKPPEVGKPWPKALVVWWDDHRENTYIGDRV